MPRRSRGSDGSRSAAKRRLLALACAILVSLAATAAWVSSALAMPVAAQGASRAPGGAGAVGGSGAGARGRPGAGGGVAAAPVNAAILSGTGVPVPPSYLGLSIEYPELPVFESMPGFVNLLNLLRPAGGAPVMLRIGGESADASYWNVPFTVPRQVFVVTQGWLEALSVLASNANLQVMLDLNLAAQNPRMAASFARAALATLPPGSIGAFEVGNEPDLFRLGGALAGVRLSRRGHVIGFRKARTYTLQSYLGQFGNYARAITAAVPGAPLAGPSTVHTHPGWIGALADAYGRQVTLATVHHYPFSSCAGPARTAHPSVAGYLSVQKQEGFVGLIQNALHSAHVHRLPLRITEFGTSVCGPTPGVTNSFATALWAADTLFALAHRGLAGVNVHMRPMWLNSALTPELPGNPVQPLFYGMALFARALGPNATILPVTPEDPEHNGGVRIWPIAVTGGLHVLVINEGPRARVVNLLTRAQLSNAQMILMQAPSPYATTGVTIAGQTIGADGTWQGQAVSQPVQSTWFGCTLAVPPYSAALLTATTTGP